MPKLDPEFYRLRGRLGGLKRAQQPDVKAHCADMRQSQEAKWLMEIHPTGTLAPEERARRLALRRKEHMTMMRMKRVQRQTGWAPKGG